ncbi:MAG TPA: hypothetical protein VKB38_03020 [Terracidiphilus sp.]|nr:hypothetical protein [Terracidiphilus sp.]
MKRTLSCLFVLVLSAAATTHAQAGCAGEGSAACAQKEADAKLCAQELTEVNFNILSTTQVTGTVRDDSGALFPSTKTLRLAIQLRNPYSGKVLRTAEVNDTGHFDLGWESEGKFRLVVVVLDGKNVLRLKGWDQARNVGCGNGLECRARVMLHAHGSGRAADICPPK